MDIVPQPWAFTAIMPGLGFLRDVMTTPFLVHWDIADGWATSPPAPERPHSRRAVHGRVGRGALAPAGRGVDPARGGRGTRGAAWSSRPMPAARSRLRPGGDARPAHAAAPGERRQLRREAALEGLEPVPARGRRRRALLDGRRPLRPGRRRGLRHGGGDGRDVRGALPRASGRGRASRDPLAAVRAERLLHRSALGRAAALHRHDGHARRRAGRQPGREPERWRAGAPS